MGDYESRAAGNDGRREAHGVLNVFWWLLWHCVSGCHEFFIMFHEKYLIVTTVFLE